MGSVIRPAVFAQLKSRPQPAIAEPVRRRVSRQWFAILAAGFSLAWILALAGTAFAIRIMVVIGLASLATRAHDARRSGVKSE
jgi:hypothetical protein